MSKLNIKAKRIVTIPYPNESLEENDKLVEDEVNPNAANVGLGEDGSEDVSEDEAEDDDPEEVPGSDDAVRTDLRRKFDAMSDIQLDLAMSKLLQAQKAGPHSLSRVVSDILNSPLEGSDVRDVRDDTYLGFDVLPGHIQQERTMESCYQNYTNDISAMVEGSMESCELLKLSKEIDIPTLEVSSGFSLAFDPSSASSSLLEVFGAKAPNGLIETEAPNGQMAHVATLSQAQGTFNALDKQHKINAELSVTTQAVPLDQSKLSQSQSLQLSPRQVGPTPLVGPTGMDGSESWSSGLGKVASLAPGPQSPSDISLNAQGAFNAQEVMVGPLSTNSGAGWSHDFETNVLKTQPMGDLTYDILGPTSEVDSIKTALSPAHMLVKGGFPTLRINDGGAINALGAFTIQGDQTELEGPRLAGFGSLSTSILHKSQPNKVVLAGPNSGPCIPFDKVVTQVDPVQLEGHTERSWAGLFKPAFQDLCGPNSHTGPSRADGNLNSNQEEFNLKFVDHGEKEANLVLKMPKELTIAGQDEWRATLVGRFLGKKLPYSLVTNVTARIWGKEGLIDTLATDSGYFFFSFSCEENRDAVLEGGPWFIAGQPLLLRPWKPHFSFSNEEIHTIPIWVNFYGVPLEYWNPKGISFISSFIGKPIRVDRTTASRRRITYARVCIEVNTDFEFFNEFHIESEDEITGETLRTKISLEYQWIPVRCKQCSQFGHDCSRIEKPVNRINTHYPNERAGKETGEWRVVARKDKGKKTVDTKSHRSKDTVHSGVPLARGNMFDALIQQLEESDPKPKTVSSTALPSVRTMCREASSSSHPIAACGEVREDHACLSSVDELDDCEVEFGLEDEVGPAALGSPISNRQKKKEAKMKFSGSRPKGRHRP